MGHLANNAFEKFRYAFNSFAAERLRLLLETKHLYQKISIIPEEICATLKQGIKGITLEREEFDNLATKFILGPFTLTNKVVLDTFRHPTLCLVVGNVKLFCAKCGTREAFRPIWFSDITKEILAVNASQGVLDRETFKIAFADTFQLFSLVFQCQRCEGIPEAFLVKREKMDFVVEGRSPIEHIEIPNYIPKDERHWFRDAIIAFQTGKVLAALFYLRTFVEQFARGKTNTRDEKITGDEILSAYADTIPANLRDTMPSLAEVYDKLSAALHGAKEDAPLFEEVRQRIEKHFDIRRVHELDSKVAATSTAKKTKQ